MGAAPMPLGERFKNVAWLAAQISGASSARVCLGEHARPDDPDIRFYFAAPLIASDGRELGLLAVMDREPRSLDDAQTRALRTLADQVTRLVELEQSEERLRTILDVVPVGVFVLDKNGTPIYANRKSDELLEKKLTGSTPDDLAGEYSAYVAGTNEPYPAERMPIVRALAGERAYANDTEIRTARGSRLIEVFGTPGLDDDGSVAYAIATFTDITERRRLERSLQLLRSIAVAANEATTFDDAMQKAVKLVCDLTGWPLGHCWLISPDDPQTLVSGSIWHNAMDEDVSTFIRVTGRTLLRLGEGLPGRVAQSAQPAWILDTQNDPQFVRSHHVPAPGVRAAFAFPVIAGGEVFAVLEFFARVPRQPDHDLLDMMRDAGEQLGRVMQRMRADAALAASEMEYRDLIENSLDLICTHDLQGRLLMVNRSAVESLGYDSPEQLIGVNLRDLMPEDIRDVFDAYMTRILSEGRDEGFLNVIRRDGKKRVWEYRNSLRYVPGSQIVRGVARDVTDRLRAERLLAESEMRYRLLFERNLAGVCRTTLSGQMLDVNDAFVHIFGYDSREEVLATNASELYPDKESRTEYLRRLTASGNLVNIESRLRRKDGSHFWGLMSATLISDRRSTAEPFLEATILDITARKESEERNAYQATHDTLTGLPNRMLFDDRLQQAIAVADRLKTRLAIGFIDLDRFKPINDEYGHAAGDAVLRAVGSRIQNTLRQSDTVARLGGDEFLMLLTSIRSREEAEITLHKIVAAVREPIDVGERTFEVVASLGMSVFPDDGVDGEALIRLADQAMYHAKTINRTSALPRSD